VLVTGGPQSRILHTLFVAVVYALAFVGSGSLTQAGIVALVAGAAHLTATGVAPALAARIGDVPVRLGRAVFVGIAVAASAAWNGDPVPAVLRALAASLVWLFAQLLIVRARLESRQARAMASRASPPVTIPGPIVLRDTIVAPDMPLQQAVGVIDRTPARIALVVGTDERLLGTVTDGDVRRAILGGVTLSDPVLRAMESSPVVGHLDAEEDELADLMREHGVRQIPVVDPFGRVVDLRLLDRLEREAEDMTPVLVMAGGLGTRLGSIVPKALVRVRRRPILEILLRELGDQGFRRIVISVGHGAEAIESYFGDGSSLRIQISYAREDHPLGTAGAIRLAAPHLDRTFIVVNADLLTRVNFAALVDFHRRQGDDLTLGVTESLYELRYGLVETDGTRVTALREKPSIRHFVNAGIYALEPRLIDLVPAGERYDMDTLINEALGRRLAVGCFPIHEYWTDIGVPADLARAASDYPE